MIHYKSPVSKQQQSGTQSKTLQSQVCYILNTLCSNKSSWEQ